MYNTSTDAWKAHLYGGCRILECIGPQRYHSPNSSARLLAHYIAAMDVLLAMQRRQPTMFGNDEWEPLFIASSKYNRVCPSHLSFLITAN